MAHLAQVFQAEPPANGWIPWKPFCGKNADFVKWMRSVSAVFRQQLFQAEVFRVWPGPRINLVGKIIARTPVIPHTHSQSFGAGATLFLTSFAGVMTYDFDCFVPTRLFTKFYLRPPPAIFFKNFHFTICAVAGLSDQQGGGKTLRAPIPWTRQNLSSHQVLATFVHG